MNLTYDEWKILEKQFRGLAKGWASYHAHLIEKVTELENILLNYERLAGSTDSPSSFFAEFEKQRTGKRSPIPGTHEGYVMEVAQEFPEISARYRKPLRFLNAATDCWGDVWFDFPQRLD